MKPLAISMVILLSSVGTSYGQRHKSVGDYYGGGPNGTIGRGTSRLPGGPLDWGGHPSDSAFYERDYEGSDAGYDAPRSSAASRRNAALAASAATAPAAPYPTRRYYTASDGFRYPIYYNPGTGTYVYYPSRR